MCSGQYLCEGDCVKIQEITAYCTCLSSIPQHLACWLVNAFCILFRCINYFIDSVVYNKFLTLFGFFHSVLLFSGTFLLIGRKTRTFILGLKC